MNIRNVQLQPGQLCMKNQILQLDNRVISHYASNRKMLEFLSIFPRHMQFVLTSSTVSGAQWCGMQIPTNTLVILHPHLEYQALIPTNGDAIEIQLKDMTIRQQALLTEIQWQQSLQQEQAIFKHQPQRVAALRNKILRVFQSSEYISLLKQDAAVRAHLNNLIIDELRMIVLQNESHQNGPLTRRRGHETVARAIIYQ